ncbi:MAG: hypothetical protein D6824_03210 [Planctomycetota bacterium]|nr:MAG: hypothetical protein D6824_03210 [Planctomycetota bacterium]
MRTRLVLASSSPRRAQLLREAGIPFVQVEPGVDDAELTPAVGLSAAAWAMALAYLKARSAMRCMAAAQERTVWLGADTLVVLADGSIVGKPADEAEARATLERLAGAEHRVLTAVALLRCDAEERDRPCVRRLFVDEAVVRLGRLGEEAIEEHVASGRWRGRAGGYNYAQQRDLGWPLACEGDEATVVGLPMRKLPAWLAVFSSGRCAQTLESR